MSQRNEPDVKQGTQQSSIDDYVRRIAAEEAAKEAAKVSLANRERLAEVKRALESGLPREVTVRVGDLPTSRITGLVHEKFELTLRLAAAGVPILLVGPAGCGKTHMVAQVAEAMKLPFYFTSVSAGMSEGVLGGRLLPVGEGGTFRYVRSEFVRAYEEGGLLLLDEIDGGDANTLTFTNSALANGHRSVPNRPENPVARRHERFVCVAAANTYGNGADRMYVGRNQLDAATLDRFRVGTVTMDYDRNLERAMGIPEPILTWGEAMREALKTHGLRRVVSTRTLLNAAKAEAAGVKTGEWRQGFFGDWKADELSKLPKDVR